MSVTEKRCPHCAKTKPAVEFMRDTNRSDGLASWCRACRNAQKVEYRRSEIGRAAAQRAQFRRGTFTGWADRTPRAVDHFRWMAQQELPEATRVVLRDAADLYEQAYAREQLARLLVRA